MPAVVNLPDGWFCFYLVGSGNAHYLFLNKKMCLHLEPFRFLSHALWPVFVFSVPVTLQIQECS